MVIPVENLKQYNELIARFDTSTHFELSLSGTRGSLFIAAFKRNGEFNALSIPENCQHHMQAAVLFAQSFCMDTDGCKTELRVAGNEQGIITFVRKLDLLGISVTRKAIRENGFYIRYLPDVGRLEVSSDEMDGTLEKPSDIVALAPKIKILIVDDSPSVTFLLKKIIESDQTMSVVGICALPSMVAERIESLKPDVITMDIEMPEMNGPTLVKQIYPKFKTPIVMISSISRDEGSQVLEALENGAIDYIQKPNLRPISELAEIIIPRLKAAASAKSNPPINNQSEPVQLSSGWDKDYVIAIGSSTGGVEALKRLLMSFPSNIPATVIAHHIPSVFSETLANRLNLSVNFNVSEAKDGDILRPNHVYIAPGGMDMKINAEGGHLVCQILEMSQNKRHHPSVDLLFESVAEHCGSKAIGILLTGMGRDGAAGMLKLKQAGAWNIAQDEASCVVYGMPKAAVEMGATHLVAHLDTIARHVDQKLKLN